MDKELLDVVLNKVASDSKIKRIIEMKMESAVPKGENFTSALYRISLKVILGNGRVSNKSLIMKKETLSQENKDMFQGYSITKAEATIYIDILQNMDSLIEEFGDTEGPLWCKLIYFSQADAIIILEDLKALGFTNVKRTEVQDLEHARLALRNIGRFHAMAKVLEERGFVSKESYRPYFMFHNQVIIKQIIYGGLRALAKGIRAKWGQEWTEAADKLESISPEELAKRIQSRAVFDDKTFKCLNHGDCWNNNMMFRHNWEGKPIEVRLIDFQGPHHNTPCVDLTYFMYTSIKPHVRRQHYKSLIELYHESLVCYLDRFGYKGSKPTIKEIEDIMERLSYFGMALFAQGFPIQMFEGTDAFDVNLVFKTGGEEGFNPSVYTADRLIEKIGEDLKTFLKINDDYSF